MGDCEDYGVFELNELQVRSPAYGRLMKDLEHKVVNVPPIFWTKKLIRSGAVYTIPLGPNWTLELNPRTNNHAPELCLVRGNYAVLINDAPVADELYTFAENEFRRCEREISETGLTPFGILQRLLNAR